MALLAGLAWTAVGTGEYVRSMACAEAVLEMPDSVVGADHHHRARCLILAANGRFLVDFPVMYALATQGMDRGAAAGDPVAVEYSAVLRARAFTNRDRHGEAMAELGDARERALARGDRAAVAFLYGVQVWAALFTGDVRGAVGMGREALAVAEPLGDYFTVGHMACNLVWATGLAGDLDGAQALIDPLLRSISDANPGLVRWFALFPGRLELWRGDLDAARGWLETAVLLATPTTDNAIVAQALPVLAGTLRRGGRAVEARAAAERALALAGTLDMPHVRAEALDELGHLAMADARPAQAGDLHHRALALRVDHDLRTFWPDSLDALAGIADDPVAAVRLLAAADSGLAAVGRVRPPVDRDPHESAVTALRAALGPDAFAGAWSAGAALTLDDAVAYAVRGRGGRGRPGSGWVSLTPTERRVVELVVAGRTNPDIGAQLFMSLSTVKTHLGHVYAKLGVANRAGLAAAAGRRQAGSA